MKFHVCFESESNKVADVFDSKQDKKAVIYTPGITGMSITCPKKIEIEVENRLQGQDDTFSHSLPP